MARPEGIPKSGGRKKGTPNKKTVSLQEAFEEHNFDIIAELTKLLPELVTEKRADVMLGLMSYLYPKSKAVEVTDVAKAGKIDEIKVTVVTLDDTFYDEKTVNAQNTKNSV